MSHNSCVIDCVPLLIQHIIQPIYNRIKVSHRNVTIEWFGFIFLKLRVFHQENEPNGSRNFTIVFKPIVLLTGGAMVHQLTKVEWSYRIKGKNEKEREKKDDENDIMMKLSYLATMVKLDKELSDFISIESESERAGKEFTWKGNFFENMKIEKRHK